MDILLLACNVVPKASRSLPFIAYEATNEQQRNLLAQEQQLLETIASSNMSDALVALRDMIHQDTDFALYIWVAIFPILWKELTSTDQEKLTGID